MTEIENHNQGFRIVSEFADEQKNSPTVKPITKVGSAQAQAHSFQHDDESMDRGIMVPKFGTWDESDPSSADGYSDIFNKVREEKRTREKVPIIKTDPDISLATQFPGQKKQNDPPSKSVIYAFYI